MSIRAESNGEAESNGGVESNGGTKSRTRAVAVAAAVVLTVATVAVIGTRWKALPWVPDAETVGTATPPEASLTPPELGKPADVASGLAVPWGLTFLPDGSALVGERPTGEVSLIAPGELPEPVGSVPDVADNGEGGLLGIVASPTFEEDRLVYAYVTTNTDNRVITMELRNYALVNAREVLTGIPDASYHDGGRLLFGPDGMLYVTTGDAGVPDNAQDLTSLSGKILRVNADGSVPDDNPFPGSPVWSYGHRNVQGLAFGDGGRLWATEFGSSAYDELNLINPGGNYGWPEVEGVSGAISEVRDLVDPQVTWPTSEASPSGLAWLDGVLYMGALGGERLWQIPVSGDVAQKPTAVLEGTLGRIRTVMVAPDAQLWLTTSNTDGRGEPRDGDDRVVSVSID
ncbi:MAG: PQQ-dependent sugar dehydrogenase [Actinomycetia bacterium]|nr:PQQ-dependent sugar dehydrogenase [Actinomycetes bacterium]